jgi:hypothetical protein
MVSPVAKSSKPYCFVEAAPRRDNGPNTVGWSAVRVLHDQPFSRLLRM